MTEFHYFVAASIDGFIATDDHGLSWLLAFDGFAGSEESYADFIADIGCVVMGAQTYRWLRENNSAAWPYPDVPSYVFTHQELSVPAGADVRFIRGPVSEFTEDFAAVAQGKNVWVLGGGDLAAQFVAAGSVHELVLSVIPVVLGSGRRLLPLTAPSGDLTLSRSRVLGRGVVENRYRFHEAT